MSDSLSIFREPPSRLAIDDDHFSPELGRGIEVWLDGYEQHKVLAYDCDAGTVERYKVAGFGELVVEDDEAVRETIHGDVRVRWKDRP